MISESDAASIQEIWKLFRDTDAKMKKTDERMKETDERMKENAEMMKETDERMKENAERMKETDVRINKVTEQLGGMGNKFGSYTESLMAPSIARILRQKFGAEVYTGPFSKSLAGDSLEIDMLGTVNGPDNPGAIYIVEIKSKFRNEHIDQLLRILEVFPRFYSEFADKPLYGMMAAVDISEHNQQLVMNKGFYLFTAEDTLFQLQEKEGFQARCFNRPDGHARDVPYLRVV